MTELNMNTTATTAAKVAFKDATPEEQKARHDAQMQRDLKFLQSRGLGKDASVDFGYLSGAVIKNDNMVSKTGKVGHRYSFVLYVTGEDGKNETKFFNFQTFSPKMMKMFDKVVELKTQAKAQKNTKITAAVFSGVNANGYRDVAWINLYINQEQVDLLA